MIYETYIFKNKNKNKNSLKIKFSLFLKVTDQSNLIHLWYTGKHVNAAVCEQPFS